MSYFLLGSGAKASFGKKTNKKSQNYFDDLRRRNIPAAQRKSEYIDYMLHKRRIELEDKAKVVALDWGAESLPR